MKEVHCHWPYPKLSGNVTLDVVVGEGHMGDIAVRVDGQLVAEGSNELHNIALGTADVLVTRVLAVTALVSPVNPNSRRTSVTCTFRSDAPKSDETCDDADHGDGLVEFTVEFSGV
jgi:hypothetical protein